jgi:hypothetical protein
MVYKQMGELNLVIKNLETNLKSSMKNTVLIALLGVASV